jgi:hypothetical protein
MPKYQILNRMHSCYDVEMFSTLSDIYCGGFQILRNARRYLPRVLGENDNRYNERLNHASYIPYFGEIVDYFVSNLFNQDLTVTPPSDSENPETPGTFPDEKYYSNFSRNADRIGTAFADVVKCAFRESIIYDRAVICVDFPSSENTAESLAEEDKLGLADAYIYNMDASELRNWKKDDDGNFQWVVLKSTEDVTDDPLAETPLCRDVFKIWQIGKDGYAEWTEYSVTYPYNQHPQMVDDVPRTGGGTTKFKNIPVLVLEIPEGLWVGNKVGTLAREHFRRRSMLQSAESRSLMAVPVAALGPEVGPFGGALPSEAQQDPHRGEDPIGKFIRDGYVVTGADDKLYYLEPSGQSYTIVDKQLSELRDEMFRVVHQMSQGVTTSGGSATRRSGLSKIKDAEATIIILGEYGRIVRRFAEQIYKTISAARGEDVSWVGRGLDTFEVDSRDSIVDEATKVDMIAIPSKTFKTEYKTQLAFQLLGNTHMNIQQAIREEIKDGVDQEDDIFKDYLKQGMLPSMATQTPPLPSPTSGSGSSAAQAAENNSRGQVGLKPKQNMPKNSAQPRDAYGHFGRK